MRIKLFALIVLASMILAACTTAATEPPAPPAATDVPVTGDDGVNQIEAQVTVADVNMLVAAIIDQGWFTDEQYDTWHTPCGQCYGYYLTLSVDNQTKTVKGVDGGTDAPAAYWQVISLVKGIVPKIVALE